LKIEIELMRDKFLMIKIEFRKKKLVIELFKKENIIKMKI